MASSRSITTIKPTLAPPHMGPYSGNVPMALEIRSLLRTRQIPPLKTCHFPLPLDGVDKFHIGTVFLTILYCCPELITYGQKKHFLICPNGMKVAFSFSKRKKM